ncbi:MAG TPA: nitrophenyl compound nitroreductase subunit ArsF family protein [Candidatus Nanoarchaeia archaeon]|nr:nitrophenyl compound nitroreductase subunit ArsF family protein [Candidatus Nanoarchaeia archaeon]
MKAIIIILLCVVLSACATVKEDSHISVTTSNVAAASPVEKVEVYHFHGTNQCSSCIAVGKLAEETVNAYFADELKTGKVAFAHINYDLLENKELASKYGVTGSSLWIGVYDKQGFHAEQNTNVWYKINNKKDYMDYLKETIEQKLSRGFAIG